MHRSSQGTRNCFNWLMIICATKNHNDIFFFYQFWDWRWRRQRHPTPVLLPGKSHGWRSLVGCSPWGRTESDTTEQLHFSPSCIGEGNGSPLQCSCLENPRDGGAWWAAVYGVTQSRTRLKWLSRDRRISSALCCPKQLKFRIKLGLIFLWIRGRFLRNVVIGEKSWFH